MYDSGINQYLHRVHSKNLLEAGADIGGMAAALNYFIMLSAASTLFKAGEHGILNAAQAAEALQPLAGNAAEVLFAIGVVGVGFLAVPVITTGAAYDLCQTFDWKYGLHAEPGVAKKFYRSRIGFTLIAMGINFPMKTLPSMK